MAKSYLGKGFTFASQPSKGGPKDQGFRNITPTKTVPRCSYTNPSKPVTKGMEHKVGKLGK
jgi:hypothetical protein